MKAVACGLWGFADTGAGVAGPICAADATCPVKFEQPTAAMIHKKGDPLTHFTPHRLVLATLAASVLLTLSACNKSGDTPGEKLDQAIEQTQTAASEATQATKAAAADAAGVARETLSSTDDALKTATQDAKAAGTELQAGAREAVSNLGSAASNAVSAVSAAASDAALAVKDALTDTAISTQIRADFAKDSELSALNIGVETNDGVVTLRGKLPSATAKTRAENLAKTAKGVKSVINEIQAG